MPDWIPQGPPREVVQVLVPLGQQVEHVRLDQRDADAAFPPSLIPPDAILSVVIHNAYTHTHTHTYDPDPVPLKLQAHRLNEKRWNDGRFWIRNPPAVLEIPVCSSDVPLKSLKRNQQSHWINWSQLVELLTLKIPAEVVVGWSH